MTLLPTTGSLSLSLVFSGNERSEEKNQTEGERERERGTVCVCVCGGGQKPFSLDLYKHSPAEFMISVIDGVFLNKWEFPS